MDNYKSSAQNENNRLNELHNDISEILFSIDVKNFFNCFKYDKFCYLYLAKQEKESRISRANR